MKHDPMYHHHSMRPIVLTLTAQDIHNYKYGQNSHMKVCAEIKKESRIASLLFVVDTIHQSVRFVRIMRW